MSETQRTPGKTTIAPDVLLTIARLTTLSVTGVSRLAPIPGGVKGFFRRHQGNGVQIGIHENVVDADIHVILQPDVNFREVSRNIQGKVARAISDMVGMEVGRINIHIEDIDYPSESSGNPD